VGLGIARSVQLQPARRPGRPAHFGDRRAPVRLRFAAAQSRGVCSFCTVPAAAGARDCSCLVRRPLPAPPGRSAPASPLPCAARPGGERWLRPPSPAGSLHGPSPRTLCRAVWRLAARPRLGPCRLVRRGGGPRRLLPFAGAFWPELLSAPVRVTRLGPWSCPLADLVMIPAAPPRLVPVPLGSCQLRCRPSAPLAAPARWRLACAPPPPLSARLSLLRYCPRPARCPAPLLLVPSAFAGRGFWLVPRGQLVLGPPPALRPPWCASRLGGWPWRTPRSRVVDSFRCRPFPANFLAAFACARFRPRLPCLCLPSPPSPLAFRHASALLQTRVSPTPRPLGRAGRPDSLHAGPRGPDCSRCRLARGLRPLPPLPLDLTWLILSRIGLRSAVRLGRARTRASACSMLARALPSRAVAPVVRGVLAWDAGAAPSLAGAPSLLRPRTLLLCLILSLGLLRGPIPDSSRATASALAGVAPPAQLRGCCLDLPSAKALLRRSPSCRAGRVSSAPPSSGSPPPGPFRFRPRCAQTHALPVFSPAGSIHRTAFERASLVRRSRWDSSWRCSRLFWAGSHVVALRACLRISGHP